MDYVHFEDKASCDTRTISNFINDTIIKLKNKKIKCYKFNYYNIWMQQKIYSTIFIDKKSMLPVMGFKKYYNFYPNDNNYAGCYSYSIINVIDLKKDSLINQWRIGYKGE